MTMNQTIRYHKGFVTSTIVSEFPSFLLVADAVGCGPRLYNFVEPAEKPRRAARTGGLPRTVERAIREEADPAFKARIARARRAWADTAYPDSPDSLAKLRLSKGLSQTQLGNLVGTSQAHIAKIEAGQVRILLETANRLASALEIDVSRLSELLDTAAVKSSAKGT